MKRLVIIDGKSVFYRGYYAMGNLAKADGTPTGGVYGFAAIAMELVKELQPDRVVVAWDKAKTSTSKRKAIFADYKAGRTRPPEDFFVQIPLLKDLILALGWAFVECDDYEADDIIGTLAKQADEDLDANGNCAWDTVIISSDLDMLQIVDANTRMYRLLKGFSDLEEMDVEAVEEKYGIDKRQFLDLKALKGDNSDNIPGVPGIGEKTAVKLLNEYGDVDGVYKNIDKITGSTQKKLIEGKDSAYMSLALARIMTDAPVKLEEMPELVIDGKRIISKLKELEFNSLVRRYGSSFEIFADEPLVEKEVEIDLSEIEVPEIICEDVKQEMHTNPELAEKVLAGAEYWDLNQAAFLLSPLQRVDNGNNGQIMFAKSREDLEKECREQKNKFESLPKLKDIYLNFDLPLIPVLYKMEKEGIKISPERFEALLKELNEQVNKLEQEICDLAGVQFNVNSPIQLSDVLFNKLALPTKGIKKTTRGFSTGAAELELLMDAHPIIPKISEYRVAQKLLSTYVMPLPGLADKNMRIHTTFTQNVTATGRLSSVNPNLQNIPVRTEEGRKIREGFVADEGKIFVSADYAQFELRLAAALAKDDELIVDFNSGVDIHTKTAAEVFEVPMDEVSKQQRRIAKTVNFGVLYGMGAKRLADQTGMSMKEAAEFVKSYHFVRKPLMNYLDEVLEQAKSEGFVETYYGRRRPSQDVNSANMFIRKSAERAARNMPIQGTEADLMKRAMIAVDKELPEGAKMILQIHDSLMVECDESLVEQVSEILKRNMENVAPELPVKLMVDLKIGKTWGEA